MNLWICDIKRPAISNSCVPAALPLGPDTVTFQNLTLQIERVSWRGTLAGCQVTVHQHLDGTLSLTRGPHRLARYTRQGVAIPSTKNPAPAAVEKTRAGKVQNPTFPPRLEIPQSARDSTFPHLLRLLAKLKTGHFTCYKKRTF